MINIKKILQHTLIIAAIDEKGNFQEVNIDAKLEAAMLKEDIWAVVIAKQQQNISAHFFKKLPIIQAENADDAKKKLIQFFGPSAAIYKYIKQLYQDIPITFIHKLQNIHLTLANHYQYPQFNNTDYNINDFNALLATIKEKKQILIAGDSGSGKTTFLRYVAYQLASNNLFYIPVIISVKKYLEKQNPKATSLIHYISQHHLPHCTSEIWNTWLKKGQLLLLFDDFALSQEPILLYQELNKATYKDCSVIIACHSNLLNKFHNLPQIPIFTLKDFNQQQQLAYIQNFPHLNKEKQKIIRESKILPKDMLYNPLILSQICIILSSHEKILDYKKVKETLIHNLIKRKFQENGIILRKSYYYNNLLSYIAYHAKNKVEFTEENLDFLIKEYNHKKNQHKNQVKYFLLDSGLLQEKADKYLFFHENIKDYFYQSYNKKNNNAIIFNILKIIAFILTILASYFLLFFLPSQKISMQFVQKEPFIYCGIDSTGIIAAPIPRIKGYPTLPIDSQFVFQVQVNKELLSQQYYFMLVMLSSKSEPVFLEVNWQENNQKIGIESDKTWIQAWGVDEVEEDNIMIVIAFRGNFNTSKIENQLLAQFEKFRYPNGKLNINRARNFIKSHYSSLDFYFKTQKIESPCNSNSVIYYYYFNNI